MLPLSRNPSGTGQAPGEVFEVPSKSIRGRTGCAHGICELSPFEKSTRRSRYQRPTGRDLDPLSVQVKTNLGWVLNWARRRDEAIEQLLKTLELEPRYAYAHFHLGNAYLDKSMFKEAIESFEKAVAASPHNSSFLAFLPPLTRARAT